MKAIHMVFEHAVFYHPTRGLVERVVQFPPAPLFVGTDHRNPNYKNRLI